ncbi:DMT family transporter [Cocleimonas sp. KMM 6892]|uniref:DMT family transporter n=1 Tax=unclassified Cocleimonas TaxID=2639732 RepID=UPI002DB7C7A9|nr:MULTISPECIES: DMT family transporter [unclassified Cocleimonas]MEB8433577.1 DMT family transporter [Cocleimonas sp. KMM 6892]MEC4716388.1 DMT family transporter [Cocleimonas sp. KMM 6895]MEC4745719.1 DMT family transporter [Cocleimonas sp. KMM 6896]
MTTTVFFAVILAALLHAVWNAIVKGGNDKRLNMAAVVMGSIPISLVVLAIFPFPAVESWGYIIASIAVQIAYHFILLYAYETGDLTQVYPIARGSGPLIVAMFSIFFLGEQFSLLQILAITMIVLGILVTAIGKQSNGKRNFQAAKLALITGCCIAGYSIIDALGAKLANNAFSYYAIIALSYGLIFPVLAERQSPGLIKRIPKEAKAAFFIGGNATFFAYAIIVWAFTQAPVALVTALRETSISFALIIGVFFLKEEFNWLKVVVVSMTVMGAILLKLSA